MRGKLQVFAMVSLLVLLAGSLRGVNAQDTGIKVKKPVFGGACKACPWGAMAEIVKTAMQPYGYDVQICYNCAQAEAPRIVSEAKTPPEWRPSKSPDYPAFLIPAPPKGPVDFGATSSQNVWYAYQGTHAYAAEGPRKNLRLLANIQSPSYYVVGVKADLGITDLGQIKQKRWPVRVLMDGSELTRAVLAYYGLSQESIEAAGGHVARGQVSAERNNFDVVLHNASMGNAPEYNVWQEVSQKYDLTYLELPAGLLDKLAKDNEMERGTIPLRLFRGIDRPIPTVVRTGTLIYGREDTPDDFAYAVAKAIDEHQDLFQWSHLNFSYNIRTVWKAYGVPLHPGAARYYRERGYMK